MNFIAQLWKSVRSNPVFVAVSSAAGGAVVSGIQDEMASGHIDWTRAGINKLTGYAVTAAVAALVHLYRPAPGATPVSTK
jgi:hypothetical protein